MANVSARSSARLATREIGVETVIGMLTGIRDPGHHAGNGRCPEAGRRRGHRVTASRYSHFPRNAVFAGRLPLSNASRNCAFTELTSVPGMNSTNAPSTVK